MRYYIELNTGCDNIPLGQFELGEFSLEERTLNTNEFIPVLCLATSNKNGTNCYQLTKGFSVKIEVL